VRAGRRSDHPVPFLREVLATATSAQPNTVRIYDFLLSAHPPFEGKTPDHAMVAHLKQPVPPLAVLGREIRLDLEAVIRRCFEKVSTACAKSC